MFIVGLTGNIGSGKSTISAIFQILGIPVYHADAESKGLLNQPDVIKEIISGLGTGMLTNTGTIDKQALSRLVFSNSNSLNILNAILHPKVKEHFRSWVKNQSAPYVMQEAAIIFESGFEQEFDKIIMVSCPKEIAISRVVKRDKADGKDVLKRLNYQLADEIKSARADLVIKNDGQHLVIPQVLAIHEQLLKISP
jgi:dephospho-CoA kinase